MNTTSNKRKLEDNRVNIKLKLAFIWTGLMFIIIYLDYFHLYMPNSISEIIAGRVFVFDITEGFLLAALCTIITPALMIVLSVTLRANLSRWLNITIAGINIPLILFNLTGIAWLHMIIGVIIEVILLLIIIYYAWKWPNQDCLM